MPTDDIEQYYAGNIPEQKAAVPDDIEQYYAGNIPPPVQPQESYAKSLGYAVPRIGYDVGKKIYNAINAIPAYAKKGIEELSGLPQTAVQHPVHLFKQLGAGAGEAEQGLLRLPASTINYLADRLHLISPEAARDINAQSIFNKLADVQKSGIESLGQPQYPGEAFIRGAARNAPAIAAGIEAGSIPFNLRAKNIAQGIVDAKKAAQNKYNSLYSDLWKRSENQLGSENIHGMEKIKPDLETLMNEIPKSKIKKVMSFYENPTRENAHGAASNLMGIRRSNYLNSLSKEAIDAVSDSISNIKNQMFRNKKGELNNALFNEYTNEIQPGYEAEALPYLENNDIRKYQARTKRIRANSLLKRLSGNEEFMARVAHNHPALGIRNALIKAAPWLAGGGALVGAGYGLGKYAFGNKNENQSGMGNFQ